MTIISQELNNRFNEVNMKLVVCMPALNPLNSFAFYDAQVLTSPSIIQKIFSLGFD
jgi:hypothetical protein